MSAVIYCRVSSEDQIRRNVQNLPTQERKCKDFARAEELDVLRVFVDEGKSARTTDRPALQELLKFCRASRGKVSHVIVADLSRLARSVTDQGVLMALLSGMKIELRSVDEPMLDGTAAGKFATNMLGSMNQYTSDALSERVRYRMQACVKQGRHVWRAPLGYKNVQNNGTKGLALDPVSAPLVKHSFLLVAAGNHTTDAVLRTVTAMGLRSKRGLPVPKQSFVKMLHNPAYAGFVVSGDLKAKGLHEALVTEEVFNTVQDVLAGKNVKVPRVRQNESFPLRGFVRCAGCNKTLTAGAAQGRKKKYERYWCWTKGCTNPVGIGADELHEQFIQLLGIYEPTTELLTRLPEIAKAQWAGRRDRITEARRQLSIRQTENDTLNRTAITAKLKGELSQEDFDTMKETIKKEAEAIETERKSLDSEHATMEDLIGASQKYYLNLVQTWQKASINERQQLQNAVFPDGLAYSVKNRFFEPQNSSVCADVRSLLDGLEEFGCGGWI
jgi:site-specific DNA recombinase